MQIRPGRNGFWTTFRKISNATVKLFTTIWCILSTGWDNGDARDLLALGLKCLLISSSLLSRFQIAPSTLRFIRFVICCKEIYRVLCLGCWGSELRILLMISGVTSSWAKITKLAKYLNTSWTNADNHSSIGIPSTSDALPKIWSKTTWPCLSSIMRPSGRTTDSGQEATTAMGTSTLRVWRWAKARVTLLLCKRQSTTMVLILPGLLVRWLATASTMPTLLNRTAMQV